MQQNRAGAESDNLDREGTWRPDSVNVEERTAELVFTAGADVARQDPWTGDPYVERLIVSNDAIDLGRLQAGAPLLDSHDRLTVRNQLGVVEDAWVEDGAGVAKVRFSKRKDAEDVLLDVADGIVRKVSVGYLQNQRSITENDGGPDLHEITRWTPFEVSFVAVPADNGAQVRQLEEGTNHMEKKPDAPGDTGAETRAKPVESQASPPTLTSLPDPQVEQRAVEAERARAGYIRDAGDKLGQQDLARELVDGGATIEEASRKLIDAAAAVPSNDEEVDHHIELGDGKREATLVDLVSRGLTSRFDPAAKKDLEHEAGYYANRPYLETARDLLEKDGIHLSRSATRSEIVDQVIALHARAAITTSILTSVNANISSRALLMGYEAVPRTFAPIFRQSSAQNYRNNERVKLGDAANLAAVAENANYAEGALSDKKETYAIAKYGQILKFTREMMVNDDLNALSRRATMLGAAAARTENAVVWGILTANGNLADTNPIFGPAVGSNPANDSGVAGVIGAADFYAARAALNGMVSEAGQKLRIEPRYVVFSETHRQAVEELVRPPSPYTNATVGNVLVESYANSVVLVLEPEVGDSIFFIAEPLLIDTVEYAWLAGNVGVNLASDTVFESDAIRFRARDEFGAGAVDRRGMYQFNHS